MMLSGTQMCRIPTINLRMWCESMMPTLSKSIGSRYNTCCQVASHREATWRARGVPTVAARPHLYFLKPSCLKHKVVLAQLEAAQPGVHVTLVASVRGHRSRTPWCGLRCSGFPQPRPTTGVAVTNHTVTRTASLHPHGVPGATRSESRRQCNKETSTATPHRNITIHVFILSSVTPTACSSLSTVRGFHHQRSQTRCPDLWS